MIIWLIISGVIRTILVGVLFIFGLSFYAILVSEKISPDEKYSVAFFITLLTAAGTLFYVFQFLLPT